MGAGTCTWRLRDRVWFRTNNCARNCHCGDEGFPPSQQDAPASAFSTSAARLDRDEVVNFVERSASNGKSIHLKPPMPGSSPVPLTTANASAQLRSAVNGSTLTYECVTARQPRPTNSQ